MRRAFTLLALAGAGLAGCADRGPPAAEATGRVARSAEGMVVTGSVPATRAGVEILAAGGNAVDAAVATAFALAVAEPTQSGLGGRTQALVRKADGEVFGVDATTEVPAGYDATRASRADFGWGTVGIPGTVAGLARLHGRGGRLPWSRLLDPAVRLATEGVVLSAGEADRLAEAAPELAESPGGRRHFLTAGGAPPAAGHRLVQPALAATLRRIAREGPDDFYRGETARVIAGEMREQGAWVTAEDLAGYAARDALVVRGRYGDLELMGTYLPASGATAIEALQILDHFDLEALEPPERIAVVGRALLVAFEDRETVQGPDTLAARRLTSREWAEERARVVRHADASAVGAGVGARGELEPAHTTHVSVVDGGGNAVAMTQSLGPTGGARVASPELGFLYAATMGYLDDARPGDRPWSSQAPLILLRDGRLGYVLGGAGARRILSALVQAVVHLGGGASLEEALEAPRFHPSGETFYLEAVAEGGWTAAAASGAEAAGFRTELRPRGSYFGRLNAVGVDPGTGELVGVGDPRWPWSGAAGPEARIERD